MAMRCAGKADWQMYERPRCDDPGSNDAMALERGGMANKMAVDERVKPTARE